MQSEFCCAPLFLLLCVAPVSPAIAEQVTPNHTPSLSDVKTKIPDIADGSDVNIVYVAGVLLLM